MFKAMSHVGVSVASLERSIGFYRDIFGLELSGSIVPFDGGLFDPIMALNGAKGRIAYMTGDAFSVELFEFDNPRPAAKDPRYPVSDHGLSHFCIDVDDIDAAAERLQQAGVFIHAPVTDFPNEVRALYARDPDGNVFELLQRPA